jgi:hypothetical protein
MYWSYLCLTKQDIAKTHQTSETLLGDTNKKETNTFALSTSQAKPSQAKTRQIIHDWTGQHKTRPSMTNTRQDKTRHDEKTQNKTQHKTKTRYGRAKKSQPNTRKQNTNTRQELIHTEEAASFSSSSSAPQSKRTSSSAWYRKEQKQTQTRTNTIRTRKDQGKDKNKNKAKDRMQKWSKTFQNKTPGKARQDTWQDKEKAKTGKETDLVLSLLPFSRQRSVDFRPFARLVSQATLHSLLLSQPNTNCGLGLEKTGQE